MAAFTGIQAGYLFLPSRYTPPLGHTCLEMCLSDRPGDCLFDARSAVFSLVVDKRPIWTTVYHRRNGLNHSAFRVGVGFFILRAHDGATVEGFSFGGRLLVEDEGRITHCRLVSPAPILELDLRGETRNAFLAAETLAQLARRQAEYLPNDALFRARLAEADPFKLFVASLATLERRLREMPRVVLDGDYREEVEAVEDIIAIVETAGEWRPPVPELADVV